MNLFSTDYQFKIPSYQRPYSWLKENAIQLFDDVAESAFVQQPLADLRPYFVGSMVLVKCDGNPSAEVIDGQQRLTTLTILLSGIRQVSLERNIIIEGQIFAPSLNAFIYEPGNIAAGVAASYRLSVRPSDSTFFQNYIQIPGQLRNLTPDMVLPDSQRRMADNAVAFLEKLESLNDQNIVLFAQYLLQKIFVAIVLTGDEEAAFRIFSVLNDRGLALSTADILKAEIIGAMPQEIRDTYSSKWDECEEALGTEDFSNLFAHIRMIGVKKKASQSTVKEIREHLNPTENPTRFIDEYVGPLADIMEEISDVRIEVAQKGDEIAEIIRWLNQLATIAYIGHTDWLPVALEMVRKLRNQPLALAETLEKLEKLTFGMMVLHRSSTARIERYGSLLREMDAANIADWNSLNLTEEEKATILTRLEGEVYEEYFCRYLLKRIDSHVAGAGAVYGSSKVVTIEHILPQNPGPESQWLVDFPSEELRAEVTNRLGNLALLSGKRNTAASNRDYTKKIETYFQPRQGHFALTAQLVANFPTWTKADFDKRHEELLAVCRAIWDL